MTTQRIEGYRYERGRDVAEDAKLMRADIKALVAAGMLPNWKYNVRIQRYSMGRSINVYAEAPCPVVLVKEHNGVWITEDSWAATPTSPESREQFGPLVTMHWVAGSRIEWNWKNNWTDEAAAVDRCLGDLHSAYNHDGSDISSDYFDVKFYGSVHVTGTPQTRSIFDVETPTKENL